MALRAIPTQHSDVCLIHPDLGRFERQVSSQNGEDGVLAELFRVLGGHTFVEIGVQVSGGEMECNCALLHRSGWRGLFIDQQAAPGVLGAYVHPMNLGPLVARHAPDLAEPGGLDLLSIDVDGQDFWIWMACPLRPKVVVIEYNATLAADVSAVVPFDPWWRWDGTRYFGASLLALARLGTAKGYTLVHSNGVNAFFVRTDLVANAEDFPFDRVYRGQEIHPPDPHGRPWVQIPA